MGFSLSEKQGPAAGTSEQHCTPILHRHPPDPGFFPPIPLLKPSAPPAHHSLSWPAHLYSPAILPGPCYSRPSTALLSHLTSSLQSHSAPLTYPSYRYQAQDNLSKKRDIKKLPADTSEPCKVRLVTRTTTKGTVSQRCSLAQRCLEGNLRHPLGKGQDKDFVDFCEAIQAILLS